MMESWLRDFAPPVLSSESIEKDERADFRRRLEAQAQRSTVISYTQEEEGTVIQQGLCVSRAHL